MILILIVVLISYLITNAFPMFVIIDTSFVNLDNNYLILFKYVMNFIFCYIIYKIICVLVVIGVP